MYLVRAGIPNNGYKFKKQYTRDGIKYKFYEKKITGLPCALKAGNCNFYRYKSVRQNDKNIEKNHKVKMGDHIWVWKKYGTAGGRSDKWGTHTAYQVFGIEAYSARERATGKINATIW